MTTPDPLDTGRMTLNELDGLLSAAERATVPAVGLHIGRARGLLRAAEGELRTAISLQPAPGAAS